MDNHNLENIDLYSQIYSIENLVFAWQRARKGKTQKQYVIDFEDKIEFNLKALHEELRNQTYKPRPLKTFILRDPKIRKISKSHFRDRVVHHALCIIIEPIFDKTFIYDCCANRKGKGTLFALNRFGLFKRKVTNNLKSEAFCLKADIKHYFQEVDHKILLKIIGIKIADEKIIWLIERILENNVADNPKGKGMPLGNLTSQFFANVYLSELDYFIKHKLRAKYYIRYVDDFVLLDQSKEKLVVWEWEINIFLIKNLKIQLHEQKTNIITLLRGIDFVGFRNFYYYRLPRKRNVKTMKRKIFLFSEEKIHRKMIAEIFKGWSAYVKWGNSYKLRKKLKFSIIKIISKQLKNSRDFDKKFKDAELYTSN